MDSFIVRFVITLSLRMKDISVHMRYHTSIANNQPLDIFGIDVVDQLGPEVFLELLIGNAEEEGALEDRGDVVGDFLGPFDVVGNKDKRHPLPVLYLQLPARKAESVSVTVAHHSEREVSFREELSSFAIVISKNRGAKVHIDAY